MRACLAVMALLLCGCDETSGPPVDPPGRAQQAAEHRLRSHRPNPVGVSYRNVRTFRQAAANTFAVCGEVNFSGRDPDRFVPFLSVVAVGQGALMEVDQRVIGENWDATQMNAETVSRCRAGGGPVSPAPAPMAAATRARPPEVPIPVEIIPVEPPPEAAAPAPQMEPPTADPSPTSKIDLVFTTGAAANLRDHPSGRVIDRVPAGAKLRVFSVAPGGWVLVGELEPLGWLHGSVRVINPRVGGRT